MPIVRDYTSSSPLLGAVAYQAGRGQFRQRQDQFQFGAAMDTARFALQAQDADRRYRMAQQQRDDALVARQQEMAFRQQQAEQQRQYEAAQQQAQMQQQAAMADYQQQQRLQYLDARNAAYFQRDQLEQIPQQQIDYAQGQVLAEQAGQTAAELRQMELDPNGERIKKNLLRKLESIDAVARDLGKVQPGAFNKPYQDWLENVTNAKLESYVVKPLDIGEHAQKNFRMAKDVFPDLELPGAFVFKGTRNGEPEMLYLTPEDLYGKPEKQEPVVNPIIKDEPISTLNLRKQAIEELKLLTKEENSGTKDANGNPVMVDVPVWDPGSDDGQRMLDEKMMQIARRSAATASALKEETAKEMERKARQAAGIQGGIEPIPNAIDGPLQPEHSVYRPVVVDTPEGLQKARPGTVIYQGTPYIKHEDGSFSPVVEQL